MFKLFSIIALSLFVNGCVLAPQLAAAKITAVKLATDTANDAFDDALWFICKAVPVGVIKIKLNAKQKKAWNILCYENTDLLQ